MSGCVWYNISWHRPECSYGCMKKNTIKLHVQVFLRMNTLMFETCRRPYNWIKLLVTKSVHFVGSYCINMCSFRLMSFGMRASDWWKEEKSLFACRNFPSYGFSLDGLKNSICTENWAFPGYYSAISGNSLPLTKTRQLEITHAIAKIFNNVSTC